MRDALLNVNCELLYNNVKQTVAIYWGKVGDAEIYLIFKADMSDPLAGIVPDVNKTIRLADTHCEYLVRLPDKQYAGYYGPRYCGDNGYFEIENAEEFI